MRVEIAKGFLGLCATCMDRVATTARKINLGTLPGESEPTIATVYICDKCVAKEKK